MDEGGAGLAAYDAQEKDGQHSGQASAPQEANRPAPVQDDASGQPGSEPAADDRCMLALFFDLFQMELAFRLLAENGIDAEQRGGAAIGYSLFVKPGQAARAHELLDAFLANAPVVQEKAQDSVSAIPNSADGQGSEKHSDVDPDADDFDIDDLDDDDIGETLTLHGFLKDQAFKYTSLILFVGLPVGALLLILFLQWLASFF